MTVKLASRVACLTSTLVLVASFSNAALLLSFARVFPGDFSPDGAAQDSFIGSSSANASLISNFGGSTFSGEARSSSEFGVMRAFVTTTMTNFQPQSFRSICTPDPNHFCGQDPVAASSGFEDTLTISGGTGVGFLGLGFDVTGTTDVTTTSSDSIQGAQGALSVFDGSFQNGTFLFGPGFFNSTTVVGAVPFIYGTPFTFSVSERRRRVMKSMSMLFSSLRFA